MKRGAAVALRLIVGLGALVWLVSRIDFGLARSTLASADPGWLAMAVAGQLGAKLFWLLRWNVLLVSTGNGRPLTRLLHWILVGLFFNNFLPSSVGGDVARGLGLARDGVPRATAAASVVLDRLIGMLALCAMAVVGGVLGRALWPAEGPWNAAAICALAAATLLIALMRPAVLDRIARARGIPEVVAARVRKLLGAMALVSGRGDVVGRALSYSLGLSACS
ncbi:MAG TPA: lysylphosphatidylglycerol synthase transmembrane domain-containing protein, partial [bacterium]|nr:lysylphosphatidylglycerol synthase transmembrane domain-containing protein [bacterium]